VANPTLPVGVLAAPASVSLTVAVHVDGVPTATVPGAQLTAVDVERRTVTVTVSLPLLAPWVASPP
jgi:hypothetical protein